MPVAVLDNDELITKVYLQGRSLSTSDVPSLCEGSSWESMKTSSAISISDDNAACEGQVNLPAWRNPEMPRQKAAQSINLSRASGLPDQTVWIFLRSASVIDRHLA